MGWGLGLPPWRLWGHSISGGVELVAVVWPGGSCHHTILGLPFLVVPEYLGHGDSSPGSESAHPSNLCKSGRTALKPDTFWRATWTGGPSKSGKAVALWS